MIAKSVAVDQKAKHDRGQCPLRVFAQASHLLQRRSFPDQFFPSHTMQSLRQSAQRIWIALRNWEGLAAILLLIAAFVCAWPEARAMATTSLWQDELHSVSHYSAKGPLVTLTTYGEPNNHIFYNLLNSLIPGKARFQPERARFLSFVFLILTVLVMLVYQARDNRLFEGSFQVFLFVANIANLDLILQARGYGLLALGAIIITVLTKEYFRKPSLGSLVGISIVVWLATWAVPTFLFFGGPLLIVLLIYTRDRRWFHAGACVLIAICIVYWPVWHQVIQSSNTYGAQWGKRFANWDAIGNLFSTYLLFGAPSWVTFLVATLIIIVFLRGKIEDPAERASACLGLAVLLTFVVSLKMETPDNHTVAFTIVPIAFILATVLARVTRSSTHAFVKLPAMFALILLAVALAYHTRKTFHFIPKENWLETAHTIEQRFPKGTEIVARFRPQWLSVYLSKGYLLTQKFDRHQFLLGKQIVLDSSFKREERFAVKELPPGYSVTTVPQRRGGGQRIYFWGQTKQP